MTVATDGTYRIPSISNPTGVEGWFHHGAKILELVEQHRPKVCVELGTWQGASAIPVARAIRRWGGTLTCVDLWAGSLDSVMRAESPWMLAACARNLMQAGVSASVRLIPALTIDAAKTWTEPIDYLYVDADHDFEAVRADLYAWVPHVKPGGLILGDDYGSDLYPGVKPAWDEFAAREGLTLTAYGSPDVAHGVQLIYGVK